MERLAFVATDHVLRGSGRFMLGEVEPHALGAAPRGAWALQPALAPVGNGFRLRPATRPERAADLVAGLTRTLERVLAALPLLRHWLDRSRAAQAEAHGASRLPDLVDLLMICPIVTSGAVAARLRITSRGAQKLIDQFETLALIGKITPRRTYRAWAIRPFSRMLGRA